MESGIARAARTAARRTHKGRLAVADRVQITISTRGGVEDYDFERLPGDPPGPVAPLWRAMSAAAGAHHRDTERLVDDARRAYELLGSWLKATAARWPAPSALQKGDRVNAAGALVERLTPETEAAGALLARLGRAYVDMLADPHARAWPPTAEPFAAADIRHAVEHWEARQAEQAAVQEEDDDA
jgi:hypothetical protein